MWLLRWVVVLAVLVAGFRCSAQDPYYTHISKAAGLPCNAVYHMFQDSKGFIWITTDEGLTRYDGYEFRTYTNARQTSLPGNMISEDMFGRIWYKNFDGYLYYVEHDTLKALRQNSSVGNSGYGIIKDRLLVVQRAGIDIFDLRTMKLVKSVPANFGIQLSEVQYGNDYYLAASRDAGAGYRYSIYRVSATGRIDSQFISEPGNMVGSDDGIFLFTKGISTRQAHVLTNGRSRTLFRMPAGAYVHSATYCARKYWLLSPNGLWIYDRAGNPTNGGRPYFPDRNTSCVLRDREGNTWIGTLNDGILFVPDFNTRLFAIPGTMPNVLAPLGGHVFIGTKDNSIYRFDTGLNTLQPVYRSPVRHEVFSLVADPIHNLLFSASDHFFWTSPDFRTQQTENLTIKDVVPVDSKYVAFAATGVSGLICIAPHLRSPWDSIFSVWQHYDIARLAVLAGIHRGKTIAFNPVTNTVYLGSNKGLHILTPGGISELRPGGVSIFPRQLRGYGSWVYMLTPQGGLHRIGRNNQVQPVPFADDSCSISALQCSAGRLFAITSSGIREVDTTANLLLPGSLRAGIRNDEIVAMQLMGSRLMVASDMGLIVLDTTLQKAPAVTPGFMIGKVLVNGRPVGNTLSDLSYTQNDIEISYSVLSFNIYNPCRVFYSINGGDWKVIPDNVRTLKLPSLSPGRYHIAFQLRSRRGNVYPAAHLEFFIRNPLWAEWWFWAAAVAVVTSGGIAYYKWQTRQLKKQNALQLEKVELEKNLRNSMLTSIRAQMNPHFFYNALNTIQSFIFSDDKRNAATYLVKLSKLTRTILEMSEKDAVSLEEETEALKLYLELEKIRFNNDFNYELRIDKSVDAELIKIPPMVVQPYIENAIKHGLLHKRGPKNLSADFVRINGNLCITIDDNGVGRTRANELAQVKRDRHQSFATSANSKRIELLNKGRAKNIGVVYIDKTDDYGNAAGTTVVISIPLN